MMLEIVQKTGQGIRFYHPDHLGSTTVVTDLDGEVTQNVAYIPYGEVFVEQRNGTWNTPYLFNAKELDEETGLYYYGARYLDPTGTRWLSVDPLFEKYVGMTPYGYCAGNPVKMVDPTGESTKVALNEDGNYTVIGGEINNDNGIYCEGTLIGYSATPTSFYNSEEKTWMGTIDPHDKSGSNFLNKLMNRLASYPDAAGCMNYMGHAYGGQEFDFKRTNGTDKVVYDNPTDFYRGMPINLRGDNPSLPVYASARDIGNMGAGMAAGFINISWKAARKGFNTLQSIQEHKLAAEKLSTQCGQYLGWRIAKPYGEWYAKRNAAQNLGKLPGNGGHYPIPKFDVKPNLNILKLKEFNAR
ncbi:MAG: RHS repeat-associated core domain-containing protein [Paludibacteraceae bacterium]|nr:RHS repeat-associated core domain-containing protein [Paludibacteraceae bacterium]